MAKVTHSVILLPEINKTITIVHTIPIREGHINTLQAAIDNWLARTDKYTATSFCEYVNAKYKAGMSHWCAWTEAEWIKLTEK